MKVVVLVTNKRDIKVGYKTALFRENKLWHLKHLINFLREVVFSYTSQIFRLYKFS